MKTFVRYAPGSGGAFICLLVYALSHDLDTTTLVGGSAHAYQDLYSLSHNFDELAHADCVVRDVVQDNIFHYYTEEEYLREDPTCADGIAWFKKNLKFDSSERHIIRTHARVLNSIMGAISNANIVNISFDPDDIDQFCYNFVKKTILVSADTWAKERWEDVLPALAYWYPDKTVTFEQLEHAIANNDIKFLCWLVKFAWCNDWNNFPKYVFPTEYRVFNITWEEFDEGRLVNRLNDLATFLDVRLDEKRKSQAINLLNNWRNGQEKVPFSVNINDF